ncbi:hypothetical protein C8F01DRAFT_1092911 [Mycena amicta]|nr:hypothetical protein C8F01DRAFT_1092911 [Mycena amicta]
MSGVPMADSDSQQAMGDGRWAMQVGEGRCMDISLFAPLKLLGVQMLAQSMREDSRLCLHARQGLKRGKFILQSGREVHCTHGSMDNSLRFSSFAAASTAVPIQLDRCFNVPVIWSVSAGHFAPIPRLKRPLSAREALNENKNCLMAGHLASPPKGCTASEALAIGRDSARTGTEGAWVKMTKSGGSFERV